MQKPAKAVKNNIMTKNLMVGNISPAFYRLNENQCTWGAGRTLNHAYPAPPNKPLGRMNRTSKRTMKAMTSL
jgi:hypothetical protein